MKNFINFLTCIFVICGAAVTACSGQIPKELNRQTSPANKNKIVGGVCDGCELMYVGMPNNIKSISYSPGWTGKGQKLLLTGTVYKLDGKTPAPNVIIYYWQTDEKGYYSPRKGMDKKAEKHGYIRGWVKTNDKGKYSIYTIRPAPYPNRDSHAHIHTSIKEPNVGNEYYIDEFVFDDDKFLTDKKRREAENRGGSGILKVSISGNLQIAEHNIILGLNIPDYPENNIAK
jgi:protocatechuate 3,4-dioxygenase beta subunit